MIFADNFGISLTLAVEKGVCANENFVEENQFLHVKNFLEVFSRLFETILSYNMKKIISV